MAIRKSSLLSLLCCLYFASAQIGLLSIPNTLQRIAVGLSYYNATSIGPSADPALALLAQQSLNGTDFFLYQLQQKLGTSNVTIPIQGGGSTTTQMSLPFEIKIFQTGNFILDFEQMCADPEVFIMIGPLSAEECVPVAPITNKCGKIYVPACGLAQTFYTNPTDPLTDTFQIATMAEWSLRNVLPYFRLANVTRLAWLWANNPYTIDACTSGMNYSSANVLTNVYSSMIANNLTWANETDVILHLKAAIDSGANGLIICGFELAVIPIAKYLVETQYAFELLMVTPDKGYSQFLTPEESDFFTVVTKVHPAIKYSDNFFPSFQDFYDEFYLRYGNEVQGPTPYFYAAAYIIYYSLQSLQLSGSVCTRSNTTLFTNYDLQWTFSRMDIPTILSPMQYDAAHRCLSTEVLIQFYQGNSYVVAPPIAGDAVLIAPAPTWLERTYSNAYSPEEITFSVLAVVFIIVSLIFIVVVIALRNRSLISASMPVFLVFILIGSIFIYVAVLVWPYHQLTTAVCHVRVWFISLGFVLMFGCLIAKSFRVWFIWQNKTAAAAAVISNSQLAIVISAAAFFYIILLSIYSGLGEVSAVVTVADPLRPSFNVESCYENATGRIMIYIMAAVGLFVLMLGLVFAFLTRKVPFLAFNESKIILFAMYNVSFFSVLALIVLSVPVSASVQYILRSLCILLSALFTVLILMGTKLWLYSHDKNARSKKSSGSSSSVQTKSTMSVSKPAEKEDTANE